MERYKQLTKRYKNILKEFLIKANEPMKNVFDAIITQLDSMIYGYGEDPNMDRGVMRELRKLHKDFIALMRLYVKNKDIRRPFKDLHDRDVFKRIEFGDWWQTGDAWDWADGIIKWVVEPLQEIYDDLNIY